MGCEQEGLVRGLAQTCGTCVALRVKLRSRERTQWGTVEHGPQGRNHTRNKSISNHLITSIEDEEGNSYMTKTFLHLDKYIQPIAMKLEVG